MTLAEIKRQAAINVFGQGAASSASSQHSGGGVCEINIGGVDASVVADFRRAFNRYRDELGNSQAVAVRRGTIALVKSLRALTIRAKKQAPMRDVRKFTGYPRYITIDGKALHRWEVYRRRGTPDEKVYVHPAESKQDARRRFGQYKKWGLARHSWGWFMRALFHRPEQTGGNPATRIDDRMVEGHYREIATGAHPRVEVLIVNRLGYITNALPPNALADAMAAATSYIDGQFETGLAEARKELK